VRRIQSGDTAVLRRVRLAALADGPDAFSTTLAEGNTLSESEWNESALRRSSGDRSVTFFAEDNAAPCGMVGGLRSDQDASTAFLVAMWVAPSHRGRGVGRQLVETVVDWATRGGHQQMELWVTESNLAAKSLYAKAGFEPTGQVQPLPSNPELLERLYRLDLSRPSRGAT
jgi:GNAT superfamily N-acetyltransferase